jgi:hypothetical protein
MMQDDFVRLHKFLLETDAISDISDDVREVVEKEWPELVHKLPPKKPNAWPVHATGRPPILKDHITVGKVGAVHCRQIRHVSLAERIMQSGSYYVETRKRWW